MVFQGTQLVYHSLAHHRTILFNSLIQLILAEIFRSSLPCLVQHVWFVYGCAPLHRLSVLVHQEKHQPADFTDDDVYRLYVSGIDAQRKISVFIQASDGAEWLS